MSSAGPCHHQLQSGGGGKGTGAVVQFVRNSPERLWRIDKYLF